MARSPIDSWLEEIKSGPNVDRIGMMLAHNGIVRGHSRAGDPVVGMYLTVDRTLLEKAVETCRMREGIFEVRAWINEGELALGDDIMYVVVAGDIRPNVLPALEALVGEIKTSVVAEKEHPPST